MNWTRFKYKLRRWFEGPEKKFDGTYPPGLQDHDVTESGYTFGELDELERQRAAAKSPPCSSD